MSQTAVNDGAGARSPTAAVGTAATVILTLLFLAPVLATCRRRHWERWSLSRPSGWSTSARYAISSVWNAATAPWRSLLRWQ
jgi:hypothetical protein